MLLVRWLPRRDLLLCLLAISLMCLASPLFAAEEEGICARVQIKISQDVAITRTAFRATLEITNDPDNVALKNFAVTLDIRDANGNVANNLFGIAAPVLSNVDDVSGSGTVGPGVTASSVWTIIPTRDAAPDVDTKYTVGGQISYTEDGSQITAPLFPATIWVKPDARLVLDYFLVRDVYGDDPFTTQKEPAEPFPLGLILSNKGKGVANHMRITSSQPQIVDNVKGLLVDFKIIGAQVNSDPVSPSLSVDLGDVGPGRTSVAQWMMTSTLQGKFIDYKATFEHVDGLGDPRLSLIDSVTMHELTHAVRVDIPDDNKPDFLVNDIRDEMVNPNHLPNKLYNSDGTISDVGLASSPRIEGTLTGNQGQVSLTAVPTAGWTYIETDDPGQDGYKLVRAVRSDGREVLVDENAWATHRTVRLKGQTPYREHRLRLLDYNSTGAYTLYYEPDSTGAVSVGDARAMADGQTVSLGGTEGLAVTALFPDCIYVESLDRTSGIKVVGASAIEGDRLAVTGTLATGENGERQIVATDVSSVGAGTLQPLGMTLRALKCGDYHYDSGASAGQKGMTGGSGLNTIGLLTGTVGRVVSVATGYFTIDDGSGQVKVITPEGVHAPKPGVSVRVTAVVSVERVESDLQPVLRVRRQSDIFAYTAGTEINDLHVENILSTSADIVWTTDLQASSVVLYGTEPGAYTQTVTGSDFVTGHKVHLPGLSPATWYYFVVQSKDYRNMILSTSEEQKFVTAGFMLPAFELTFPTGTAKDGVVTASAHLSNTGGDALNLQIAGIQTYPSTIVILTTAPTPFGEGKLAGGESANQDVLFQTAETQFYAKLTITYRDLSGVSRTLTTPWKKVTVRQ